MSLLRTMNISKYSECNLPFFIAESQSRRCALACFAVGHMLALPGIHSKRNSGMWLFVLPEHIQINYGTDTLSCIILVAYPRQCGQRFCQTHIRQFTIMKHWDMTHVHLQYKTLRNYALYNNIRRMPQSPHSRLSDTRL